MRRGSSPRKRTPVKAKRATPRRREAPRWQRAEWETANVLLQTRSLGRCEICNTDRGPFERHHRKRRRDGGDRLANIVLLCRPHHQWVTEHPAEARRSGWIVSVNRDPAEVPFLWHRRDWMMLDDEGGKTYLYDMAEDADAHA
jgi:hypothetical protein